MSEFFVEESDISRHTIFPGVEIQTAACRSMMMSLVEFHPYAVVEKHSHPHEQVGIIIEGRAHFFVGDDDCVLGPGDMYRIPGGVEHRVVALDETVKAFDIFNPIREDYL
jgi:quercetin dioxygenase-like cupin family protein